MGQKKSYHPTEPEVESEDTQPVQPAKTTEPPTPIAKPLQPSRPSEPGLSHPASATQRAAAARTAQRQQGNLFLQQLINKIKTFPPVFWSIDPATRRAMVLPRSGVSLQDVAEFLYGDPATAADLASVNGIDPNAPLVPNEPLRLTDKKLTPVAFQQLKVSPKVPSGVADPEAFVAKKYRLDSELEQDFNRIVKKLDERHYSDSDEGQVIAILKRWGTEKFTTKPQLYPRGGEYLDKLFSKLTQKKKDVGIITTQWTNYYSLIFNHFDRVDEVIAIRDEYSRNFKRDRGFKEMSFGSFFWEEVKEGRIRDQIFAYFKGLADAGVGLLKGLKTLVTDPGKVLEAIGRLPETLSLLWKHRKRLWQQFMNATPEEQARMIGRLFGEIELLIATVGAGGGARSATSAPQLATATAVVPGRGGAAAAMATGGGAVSVDLAKLGEGARMTALTNQLGGASEAAKQKADKVASEAKAEAAATKNKAKSSKTGGKKSGRRRTDPYETSLPEAPEMRAEAQNLANEIARHSLPEGTSVRPVRIERTTAGRAQSRAVTPKDSPTAMEFEFDIRFRSGLRVKPDGIQYLENGRQYFFLEHKEVLTIWERSHYAREAAIPQLDAMLSRHAEAYLLAKEHGCLGFKYSTNSPELAKLLAERISLMPSKLRQGLLAP